MSRDPRVLGPYPIVIDVFSPPREPAELPMAMAVRNGDFVVNGACKGVLDAGAADRLIVPVKMGGRATLLSIERRSPGIAARETGSADPARHFCEVRFRRVKAGKTCLLAPAGKAWPLIEKTLQKSVIACAEEMVGGAQRVLESAVDYAKARRVYGRPIGSYQAVAHRLADMHKSVESARALTVYAAYAASRDLPETPMAASMAKAACSDMYLQVVNAAIQTHGAAGYAWEHELNSCLRSALLSRSMFGDASYHRELIARRLLGDGSL